MCGVKSRIDTKIEVVGSCMQTSQNKSHPHVISGLLIKENNSLKIKNFIAHAKLELAKRANMVLLS